MAALSLQETDSAVACALAAFGTGLTLGTGTNAAEQAQQNGTAGTATNSPSLPKAVSNEIAVGFECIVPNGATWASGTWTIKLNVTTANSNLTWTECWIVRVSSGCAAQATIGSNAAVGISLGTAGVKSATVSGSAQTPAAGDKVYVLLAFSNSAAHSAQSFSYIADQLIATPFTASSSVSVTATDSESFSESFVRDTAANRSFSDSESFSESVARKTEPSRTASDAESFSDTIARTLSLSQSLLETESFSESPAGRISVSRTASDSESLSETLAGNRGVSRSATDTVTFSESLTRTIALRQAIAETFAESEVLARLVILNRAAADNSSASDAAGRATGAMRATIDSAALSESLARLLALARASADSVSFSESSGENVVLPRGISDTKSFSESLAGAGSGHGASVTAADSESFADLVAEFIRTARTLADSFSFSDSLAAARTLTRFAADAASFSDSIARLLTLDPPALDSFVFSEQIQSASSWTPRQAFTALTWQLALREAASDVAGTHILGEFPSPLAIQLSYPLAASAPLAQVDTFITAPPIPNSTAWGKGSYALTLVVQSGKNVSFTVELWRADANGNDIAQIGSRPAANLGPSVGPATFVFTVTDAAGQVASATDRLKLKMFAQNTDTVSQDFAISASLSFLVTPILREFQVSNNFNGMRRGRFLGKYFRPGENSGYFDQHGVDLN